MTAMPATPHHACRHPHSLCSDGSLSPAAAKIILKELPDKSVYFITGGAEAWQVRLLPTQLLAAVHVGLVELLRRSRCASPCLAPAENS